MATVTVTANLKSIGGIPDSTVFTFRSPVVRLSEGDESIVTVKPVRVEPVAGILTAELEPGLCLVSWTGSNPLSITIPESDSDLWPLIEEALAALPAVSAPSSAFALRGRPVDEVQRTGDSLDFFVQGDTVGSVAIGDLLFDGTIDGISDAETVGKAVVRAESQSAARTAIGAPSVSVKDYGAVGNNSVEDTEAIQDAIDAAAAIRVLLAATKYQNITVHFPPGRYIVGALTVGDGIKLEGDAAILNPPAGFTGTMITLAGNYAQLAENLFIRGNGSNGEQAVEVEAGCYHNHISSTFQNWGGKVIVDNAGGTHIDSRFIEGMRNTAYINSFAAGEYIGVVELKGSDAGYIIGSEINASRYTYGGTSLGASTNGVVTPLLVAGCNALVYGAVCENGDVGIVVPATGPFGSPKWNHFIAVRGEFNFQHGFLFLGGSGVLDACRAMGNGRTADNASDGFHVDAGTWTVNGCHSTSEFPADGKTHRYGLYKATGATLARNTFRSTSDHNAYYDGTTAFLTPPDQSPNVANINGVDGGRVLKITSSASAVNYLEVVNRATGAPAYIAAQGDANQDFGFQPRGTGGIFVFQPSGSAVSLKAQGAAADVGWNLTTKGAGVVNVNNAQVYASGGPDVSLADGGTGASLADPNADRIMFWDDSAGAMTWLALGTNLAITGTTLDASGGGGGGGTGDATATASTLAQRDGNANLRADAFVPTATSTATAAGTTTLTVDSAEVQLFTGGSAQTVVLPTTSVVSGQRYTIINNSTGTVTVQTSNLTTIIGLTSGQSAVVTSRVTTPATASDWNLGALAPNSFRATASAASVAVRDAQSNLIADNFISTATSIATAAGTTTLAVDSSQVQVFTGTTTQTVLLPTTSIAAGQSYTLVNNSTGIVTVQSSGANVVGTVAPSTTNIFVAQVATPTTAAHWQVVPTITGAQRIAVVTTIPGSPDPNTVYIVNDAGAPRVTTITSSATPAINTDACDAVTITALAAAITSMTTSLTGTPHNFQKLMIRIKDNGTARAIAWGASFEAGTVALPTTTVVGKTLLVGLVYDAVDAKWACEATGSRA